MSMITAPWVKRLVIIIHSAVPLKSVEQYKTTMTTPEAHGITN